MSMILDGNILFDERNLEISADSITRASKEKHITGLDGVLTIDLGRRSRKVKQTGTLRAKSRSELISRLDSISKYIDGTTHTLVSDDGAQFENLRMDSFKITSEGTDGAGVVVDYKIVYTQLF
ncbi:hypothetical protein ACFLZ8_01575 [Planctomycetota bacterium]